MLRENVGVYRLRVCIGYTVYLNVIITSAKVFGGYVFTLSVRVFVSLSVCVCVSAGCVRKLSTNADDFFPEERDVRTATGDQILAAILMTTQIRQFLSLRDRENSSNVYEVGSRRWRHLVNIDKVS